MRALRERLRRPALLLLALNAAVLAVYTLPRSLQERSLSTKLALLRAEAGRERGQIEALRRRSSTLVANKRDTERIYAEVLKSRSETLLPVVEAIHAAAEESGIDLGREGFHKAEIEDTPLTRVTITLPVSGDYRQLVGFLGRLERSKLFVSVDGVTLRGREGESADLQLVLTTYYRTEGGGGDAGA